MPYCPFHLLVHRTRRDRPVSIFYTEDWGHLRQGVQHDIETTTLLRGKDRIKEELFVSIGSIVHTSIPQICFDVKTGLARHVAGKTDTEELLGIALHNTHAAPTYIGCLVRCGYPEQNEGCRSVPVSVP